MTTQTEQTDTFLDDFRTPASQDAGQGKPLPMNRTYVGTIHSELKDHESYRYGQATFVLDNLTDVATGGNEFPHESGVYKIGKRKVFHRIGLGWIGEDEEKVAQQNRIAKEQLYQLAFATGLATKEKVDGKFVTSLTHGITEPESLVKMLDGRRVEFRVKHRAYQDRDGNDQVDAQPGWFAPTGGAA